MEFSQKVRYAREKLNISQEDLARALNVSYATINRWENDRNRPVRMARVAFDNFCETHGVYFIDNKIEMQSGVKEGDV